MRAKFQQYRLLPPLQQSSPIAGKIDQAADDHYRIECHVTDNNHSSSMQEPPRGASLPVGPQRETGAEQRKRQEKLSVQSPGDTLPPGMIKPLFRMEVAIYERLRELAKLRIGSQMFGGVCNRHVLCDDVVRGDKRKQE